MKLESNQTIDNRYEVIEKIGEGELGIAWKATDNRLNDEVVIKTPQSTSRPALLKQFKTNALLMRRLALECINILDISDVGSVGDYPYYVVRHVAGGNLRNRQSEPTNSNQGEWKRGQFKWLSQIAAALDYLHKNDVMHRSVKPENILFNRSGLSYLVDFGITATSEQTQTHTAPGKDAANWTYAPPEHLSGDPFMPQSDQYSLAVSLYEAVLGEAPFSGATPFAIVRSIMKGHRNISDAIPDFPAEASFAIDRAMSIEFADRFENCKQFADAFLTGLDSGPRTNGDVFPGSDVATGSPTSPVVDNDEYHEDEEEIVAEVDEPEERPATSSRNNSDTPQSNDVILDRYKVIERIATDCCGVLVAYDTKHQTHVAIKTTSFNKVMLFAEAEGIRSLDGFPGIPKVFDICHDNDTAHLVLEYLPGGNLRDWQVQYDANREFLSSFHWLVEIAQTLDQIHSHANSVIHNDVRPDNILFNAEGKAFLIDWRQSSFTSHCNDDNDYGGLFNLKYSATFYDDQVSAKSDQYSLAVTLYEFLAGQCPYEADSFQEFNDAVQSGHAPLYTKIIGFPLSASNVVDRGLSLEAEQRFESCGHFAAAFMEALRKDSTLFETNFPIAPYKPRKIADLAKVPDAPPQASPAEPKAEPEQIPTQKFDPVDAVQKTVPIPKKPSRSNERKAKTTDQISQPNSNEDAFPVQDGYGSKLDGRYVLLEPYPDTKWLWKARDLEDDRFVTLRFWDLGKSNRDAIKERNDAIRWISIVHPVLQLKSVGEVGGYYWSVTELPDGGYLEDRILTGNGHKRFSIDLGWVSKIAKTVDELDQHTDSPTQLLIETYSIAFDASGEPYLCNLDAMLPQPPDWPATLTWHGSDLRFRAPENSYRNFQELMSRGISDEGVFVFQSQTFAFAVTLIKKLTGKYPSDFGLTQFSWNEADLDDCVANLTPHMRAVFRKALAFDPRDRYGNCTEFASALTIANQSLLELAPRPINWHCIECGEEPNSHDDSRCNQCGWQRKYPDVEVEPESYCSSCGAASNQGNFCEWCGLSLYEH